MKIPKLVFIYVFIAFLALTSCFVIDSKHSVTISYRGFGIDSKGDLYVGKESSIEVIKHGQVVNTIIPPPSRNYAFTIEGDNTILLSDASTVYTLDLSGKVLSEDEDEGTRTFNRLQKSRRVFTSNNGEKYIVKKTFGRTTVYSSTGEIVYQMPLLDYIVELILIGFILLTCICIPIIIYKWKLVKKTEKT